MPRAAGRRHRHCLGAERRRVLVLLRGRSRFPAGRGRLRAAVTAPESISSALRSGWRSPPAGTVVPRSAGRDTEPGGQRARPRPVSFTTAGTGKLDGHGIPRCRRICFRPFLNTLSSAPEHNVGRNEAESGSVGPPMTPGPYANSKISAEREIVVWLTSTIGTRPVASGLTLPLMTPAPPERLLRFAGWAYPHPRRVLCAPCAVSASCGDYADDIVLPPSLARFLAMGKHAVDAPRPGLPSPVTCPQRSQAPVVPHRRRRRRFLSGRPA